MKELKRDDASIDYHISGHGEVTLLFVHGSYIDQTYWEQQVAYFKPDYKVVTFDLPAHGKSGKERKHWSVKGFADDVIFVIKELKLKNVILIGHSLAGEVNLIAATSYPDPIIGFIVIDIIKNAATPLPPEFQQQVTTIEENLKKDFANTNENYARMALLTKDTPEAITHRIVSAYRNAYQPMGIATTPEIFDMYKVEEELLPRLKFKLFLINVDYIPTNEEALKKHTKHGYELVQIKGTCHYPMLENPDELNWLLEQTIGEIVS